MPRWTTRPFTALVAVFLCLFTLAACDSNELDDEDLTQTDIRSFPLNFDLRDAQVATADYGTGVANLGYDTPEVGESVLDNGAVLVYIEDQFNTWKALPFTVGIEKIDQPVVDYTYTMNYAYDFGYMEVFVRASTDDPVVWDEIRNTELFRLSRELKVVLIDEFIASRARASGVNLRSYSEVKAHFGLEE